MCNVGFVYLFRVYSGSSTHSSTKRVLGNLAQHPLSKMASQRRRCVVVSNYLVHTGKLRGRKTTYTDRRGARHKGHRHNTRHDYRLLYYPAKRYLIFSLQSTAPLEALPNCTLSCPFKVLHRSDRYISKDNSLCFPAPFSGQYLTSR